jgi:hypothetical protein
MFDGFFDMGIKSKIASATKTHPDDAIGMVVRS